MSIEVTKSHSLQRIVDKEQEQWGSFVKSDQPKTKAKTPKKRTSK